jgi:ssDNA thymidine ADP-ribosyltransferase, DarT
MPYLNNTYLFRITHIENIPHILQHGITHSTSLNANRNFVPIGDGSLIATRNNFLLNNGRLLGEYIPFYFGLRTPML